MAINGKSNCRDYLGQSVDNGQQVFLQSPLFKTFTRVRNVELAVIRIVVLGGTVFYCCCCVQGAGICTASGLTVFS